MDNQQSATVIVCVNQRNSSSPSCADGNSIEIANHIEQEIIQNKINASVERINCLGECNEGPNIRIAPGGSFFHHFTISDIPKLMEELSKFLAKTSVE